MPGASDAKGFGSRNLSPGDRHKEVLGFLGMTRAPFAFYCVAQVTWRGCHTLREVAPDARGRAGNMDVA